MLRFLLIVFMLSSEAFILNETQIIHHIEAARENSCKSPHQMEKSRMYLREPELFILRNLHFNTYEIFSHCSLIA